MNYKRILPRDAFNESYLLKQIGRLTLIQLDNHKYTDLFYYDLIEPEKGFIIIRETDGSTLCENFKIYKKSNDEYIKLTIPLIIFNQWGLIFNDIGYVFNNKGNLSKHFITILTQD